MPDDRAVGCLLPGAVCENVDGPLLHPLAELDLLLQHYPADGDRLLPAEDDFRRAVLFRRDVPGFVLAQGAADTVARFRRGGGYICLFRQVDGIAFADVLAQLTQSGHVICVEETLVCGRDVQQEGRVAAHGFFINVDELFQRTHLVVLALMPEPAGTN